MQSGCFFLQEEYSIISRYFATTGLYICSKYAKGYNQAKTLLRTPQLLSPNNLDNTLLKNQTKWILKGGQLPSQNSMDCQTHVWSGPMGELVT